MPKSQNWKKSSKVLKGFAKNLNEKYHRSTFDRSPGPGACAAKLGEIGKIAKLVKIRAPELPAQACENTYHVICIHLRYQNIISTFSRVHKNKNATIQGLIIKGD